MMGLSDTIFGLRSLHNAHAQTGHAWAARLKPLVEFGSNPGSLAAKSYVPGDLAPGAALVVVLHGCTQDAEGYDRGSGWSRIADEQGLALLFPQQVRANNANLCFNWFEPGDTRRGAGEVASIVQMIEAMTRAHGLDRGRVFVTGLSAGGAMTAALLAAYPDIFAGGAIIAGLPHGVAAGVVEALAQMRAASASPPRVRTASAHTGPWPTISIWHGDADHVVHPSNAVATLDQWRAVHSVADTAARHERGHRYSRSVWRDRAGRDVIEYVSIDRMGHGTPLSTTGPEACGVAGPHMLDVGVSSTRRIAAFWGLCGTRTAHAAVQDVGPIAVNGPSIAAQSAAPLTDQQPAGAGPGRIIEDALRAAGLMR